ncbi:MAG: DUF2723 domain-containing protein, partial [Alistipes sp.]|nr:DUF2723 domain-containing protein [Alistipes sp.]
MWSHNKRERDFKPWAAYRTKTDILRDDDGEIIRDAQGRPQRGEVLDYGRTRIYDPDDGYEPVRITEPTFGENLCFFFSYQLNYMYWRYFLWNFVGRQNDIQANGATITDGNWLSGIGFIDRLYLGPQENLPREVAENPARNTYYFLPFLLGIIGLVWHANRDQRNFAVVMWLFIMMGIALVVYFNTQPGEPRERDYVYAGSFYAFCIWIGLGVLALREMFASLLRGRDRAAVAAATVIALAVPGILAAENWDDHDRSHRTWARDIGWNYLQSTLPNSIIINYGDNDTFPLWFNQEVDGVRTDVRIMNTSYLNGDWYIEEMRDAANESAPVPFTLPRSKYMASANDFIPVVERVNRAVTGKEVIDFIASEHPNTKIPYRDEMVDYIPSRRIAIPVDKDNAIASGIVCEQDRDKMVDTVYIDIKTETLDKSQMMLVDLLANFEWKRPLFFTQTFTVKDLGLLDYMQFDGFAYRLVPIRTPYDSNYGDVGRVDPAYAAPLLLETFRYGNLADERVLLDHFTQFNINAAHLRDGFARVAMALIDLDRTEEAVELLDKALEVLPTSKLRFTYSNTFPLIHAYYLAGEKEKGDALLMEYAENIIEYIEYYLTFEGIHADMVTDSIDYQIYLLDKLYYLAAYAGRRDIVAYFNDYYRSLGAAEDTLIDVGESVADTTLLE